MKLHFLSFNARSLNEDSAVAHLQSYIKDCIPPPDVVAIQEHKLRGLAATQAGGRLWKHATSFSLEASVGYGHDPFDQGAGCGGVITLVHPRWKRKIGASGSLLDNRVHWFVIQGLPGGDIGFANIYALNDSRTRCLLWEALARDLPRTCRWILMGDFNMVEHQADKTRQCISMIPRRERTLFDAMKMSLQVEDHPRSTASLRFSWDNNRPQAARVLARLDRLYIFNSNPGSSDRTLLDYCIRGNMTRLDHHPVTATLQLAAQLRRATHWKMSCAWFDEAAPEITRLWNITQPGGSFFTKLRRILRFYKGFCKNKAQTFRADEEALVAIVEANTRRAQDDPSDEVALRERGESRLRLEAYQDRKIEGASSVLSHALET